MSVSEFSSLGLAEPLLRAVTDSGYLTPTPIQLQAIPAILQGGDILAAAQTGTGKTAGFTLPLLQRLMAQPDNTPGHPRALVLTPTRELAAQVEESVRTYSKYLTIRSMVMFGGVSIKPQINALKRPVDILVATPGRLLDHLNQKTLSLANVEVLVLDEADRMLDMGFIHDIRKVMKALPAKRQNLLFSATFSDDIKSLANSLLHQPQLIEVAKRNSTNALVDQKVILADKRSKTDLLIHLIREQNWFQALVFTRTKHGANRLAEKLDKVGIPSEAIHGNKSQNARTRALSSFKDGKLQVLVATDIAARGLDIDQLPYVVNFELPNMPEDYVHRIGRTGRAGSNGEAISLVCGEEMDYLKGIESLTKQSIPRATVPGFDMAAAARAAVTSAPASPGKPRQDAKPPRQAQPPRKAEPRRERDSAPRSKAPAPRQPAHAQSTARPAPAAVSKSGGIRQPVSALLKPPKAK